MIVMPRDTRASDVISTISDVLRKQDEEEKEQLNTYIAMASKVSPELLYRWMEDPSISRLFQKHNIPISLLMEGRVTKEGLPASYEPVNRPQSLYSILREGKQEIPAITPEVLSKIGITKEQYRALLREKYKDVTDLSSIPLGDIAELYGKEGFTEYMRRQEDEKMRAFQREMQEKEIASREKIAREGDITARIIAGMRNKGEGISPIEAQRYMQEQKAEILAEGLGSNVEAVMQSLQEGNLDTYYDFMNAYGKHSFARPYLQDLKNAAANPLVKDVIPKMMKEGDKRLIPYIKRLKTTAGLEWLVRNRDNSNVRLVLVQAMNLGGLSEDHERIAFPEYIDAKTGIFNYERWLRDYGKWGKAFTRETTVSSQKKTVLPLKKTDLPKKLDMRNKL